jgi:ubiquinone/menaquinone biosynthesis C-methylase UbiE
VSNAEATVAANQRWFGRWATRYESNPLSGWLSRIQDVALAALELRAEDVLLDVGCGTGAAVRKAAPTVREAVGVDVAPAMVVQARRLAEGLPNVDFVEGDSRELPFDEASFTAVVCTTSFHHYPDPAGAVREMARVLQPGGRLVIGDPCADRLAVRVVDQVNRVFEPSHVGFYHLAEFSSFLSGAGFAHGEARRIMDGAYVFVRATKPA